MGLHRPDKFTVHNLIGHVVSELLWLLGCEDLSRRVHDSTLPRQYVERAVSGTPEENDG